MSHSYGRGPPFPPLSPGSETTSAQRRFSYAAVAAGPHTPSLRRGHSANNTNPTARETTQHHTSRSMDADSGVGGESGQLGGVASGVASGRRATGTGGVSSAAWESDSLRYGMDPMGNSPTHDHNQHHHHRPHQAFFTPSYLRKSRHVQRLRHAYNQHISELNDHTLRHNSAKAPSLSASSSSVNLNKLPPTHVHRGVVQDVVERVQSPLSASAEEENLQPLPSRWNDNDKMSGLDLMADGTEIRFSGVTKTTDEAAAVRSDHPMPKECGIFYFEVTVLSRGKDGWIGIGFSSKKAGLNRLPGWEADSWAYHGDDGYVFACTTSGKAYGPKFAAQDVIGCGMNFRTGSAFFTKSGNFLGTAFSGIKADRLYPSVGMKRLGEHVRVNFGKTPFIFDIDSMMEKEKQIVLDSINGAEVSSLHPPDNENALIHRIIDQYLAHEGYVETTKAFARDAQDRQQILSNTYQPVEFTTDEDDVQAITRQKIRRSILDGEIDRALKYMNTYYPRVLEDEPNRDIYFRLRCRKFVEMMRQYTELAGATSSTTTLGTNSAEGNGHIETPDEEEEDDDDDDDDETAHEHRHVPDTQMELDDQLHREASTQNRDHPPSLSLSYPVATDDIDMDAAQDRSNLLPKLSLMKVNDLLAAAVTYGQELREEFGSDPRPAIKKQLTDIFAIMAYSNLSSSPVSHLFNAKGRAQIAEDVNGAILVSLGKPSSAALEKLAAQTEALLEETAHSPSGGAAALIHVQTDLLQDEN